MGWLSVDRNDDDSYRAFPNRAKRQDCPDCGGLGKVIEHVIHKAKDGTRTRFREWTKCRKCKIGAEVSLARTRWAVVVMHPRTSGPYFDQIELHGPFPSRAAAQLWLDQRDELRWSRITRIAQIGRP